MLLLGEGSEKTEPYNQGPAIINWLSNNCNLIGFNDCFDASANYQLLFLGICQLSIIDIMVANNWQLFVFFSDEKCQLLRI